MADSLFRNEKKEIKDHFRDYCSNYNSIEAVITKVRDYFFLWYVYLTNLPRKDPLSHMVISFLYYFLKTMFNNQI